jgi:transcriptional regulator with XRE-family HTH domain
MLHLVQPDDVNAAVGANVATIRAELGWSQAELAERWGNALGHKIDPTTITRLERGRRPIPIHELIALGTVLDVGWANLVMPPTILAAAKEFNAWSSALTRAYEQIRDAVEEYLKAQHSLALVTQQAEDLGVFDTDREAWRSSLTFPPKEAFLLGQIRGETQVAWQRDKRFDPTADYKRIQEVIAVLRDRGVVADPGEASGGEDVEHQETQ